MAKIPLATSGTKAEPTTYGGFTRYVVLSQSGISVAGSEASSQITYRVGGVLSELYVRITANTLDNTETIRTRKNAGDANLVVSITAGSTGEFTDSSNTDTVSSGEKWNYIITNSATAGGELYIRDIITNFSATSNTTTRYANVMIGQQTDATSSYQALSGCIGNITSTEAYAKSYLGNGNTTFGNLFVYVSSNDVGSASTVAFRDDGSSTYSVSITASTTGVFENTGAGVTPAVNSLIGFLTTVPSVSGTHYVTFDILSIEGTSTDSTSMCSTDNSNGSSVAYNASSYFNLVGLGYSASSEVTFQRDLRVNATVSHVSIYVSANTNNGTSYCYLRKNGGNTTVVASITASTTGQFTDTTHTESITSTDTVNYYVVGGGTTGSMALRSTSCMITIPAVVTSTYVSFLTLLGVG